MAGVGALENVPGATFRAQLNTGMQEIARGFTGTSAPDPVYPHQLWRDSSAWLIKRRNGANTAWVTIGTFTAAGLESYYVDGAAVSAAATRQANLAATAAPTASDGASAGYAVGSLWIDTTADIAWQCLDATSGAAVWRRISWAAFAEGVAGVVPAPTSGDITAGRVLSAAGTWVTPSEWVALARWQPDGTTGTEGVSSSGYSSYRRLRFRLEGLRPATDNVDVRLQVHAGGAWRTASGDYITQARYQVPGQQYLTTDAPPMLNYTGARWGSEAAEVGAWEAIITSDARVHARAVGSHGTTTGVRSMTQVEAISTFAGPATGVRAVLSAGNFTATTGWLVVEGALT